MQRKIKFRVWDNLKKEWVSNKNIWRMKTDPNGIGEIEPNAFYWKQHPQALTIQQYTGLKDKNGVEIYEGDIINIFNHNQAEEVMYEPYGTAFGFFKHDSASREDGTFEVLSDYTATWNGYEIIGNIFENSELLEA